MFGLFKKKEKRSIDTSDIFLGYTDAIDDEDNSPLSIPALNQAVDVISTSVASLKLRSKNSRVNKILEYPNDNQTSYEMINNAMRSLLVDGNAYIETVHKNGVIVGLESHHHSQVSQERVGFDVRYRVADGYGRSRVLLSHEMIHIKQNSKDKIHGTSKVRECRRAINLAIKQAVHAKNYANNSARPSGVLESDSVFTVEGGERVLRSWNKLYGGSKSVGKTAFLDDGLKFKALSHNMIEADFVKISQMVEVEQISRIMNISPILLNDYRYASYQSPVEANRTFLSRTLRPFIVLIEAELNKSFKLPNSLIEFDTSSLLKMAQGERFDSYKVAIDSGFMSVDEVRKAEGLEPLPSTTGVEVSADEN